MLVGLTESGKSTFIDGLLNYVFDTRFEDTHRLRLVNLTKDESSKFWKETISQTDYISVYKIKCLDGMNVNYDLTIVDTPGFGDSRGDQHDEQLMQDIFCLLQRSVIHQLDAIGFVAKAGDTHLTERQRYVYNGMVRMFGSKVSRNMFSVLTNYDGHSANIMEFFKENHINFVDNFCLNSKVIKNPPEEGFCLNENDLNGSLEVVQFHSFFKEARRLCELISKMNPFFLEIHKLN